MYIYRKTDVYIHGEVSFGRPLPPFPDAPLESPPPPPQPVKGQSEVKGYCVQGPGSTLKGAMQLLLNRYRQTRFAPGT